MTLAHLVALDDFALRGPGGDGAMERLVRELEAGLDVVLVDGRGRPTDGATELAAQGRLVLAAAAAFFAEAEALAAGATVVRLDDHRPRTAPGRRAR